MPNTKSGLFLDTNLLVYALDKRHETKREIVGGLIASAMANQTLVLSPQSLNEFYRVITDRLNLVSRSEAHRLVDMFAPFCSAPLDSETTRLAWTVQDQTGFSWWDCVMLASALQARCAHFLSEDLQSGRILFEMKIENPFV